MNNPIANRFVSIPVIDSDIELRLAKFYKKYMFLPGNISECLSVVSSTQLEIIVKIQCGKIKRYKFVSLEELAFLREFSK